MAFLYDPGIYMPSSVRDFVGSSWMSSWPDGPWHLHDVEIGGMVLLVDAGPAQRIVWQTRVTHTFSVPYEASGELKGEILRRWGRNADVSKNGARRLQHRLACRMRHATRSRSSPDSRSLGA